MKYVRQFGIILILSFVGELLNHLIPLPIPASIYGILLMLLCLKTHIITTESVRETSRFLIEIMPLMFIPAAVGLLEAWDIIRPSWIPYIVITLVSTVIVMGISGRVTQAMLRRTEK